MERSEPKRKRWFLLGKQPDIFALRLFSLIEKDYLTLGQCLGNALGMGEEPTVGVYGNALFIPSFTAKTVFLEGFADEGKGSNR